MLPPASSFLAQLCLAKVYMHVLQSVLTYQEAPRHVKLMGRMKSWHAVRVFAGCCAHALHRCILARCLLTAPPCLCPAVALLEGAGCDTRRRAGSIRSVLCRERRAHLGW